MGPAEVEGTEIVEGPAVMIDRPEELEEQTEMAEATAVVTFDKEETGVREL